MKNFSFLLLLFNILTIFWNKIGGVEAIVGGHVALKTDFKYVVSFRIPKMQYIGTGVIIGEQHVLVSANTIIGKDNRFINDKYSIKAGSGTISGQGRVFYVDKIYVPKIFKRFDPNTHPTEMQNVGNIAVLKLTDPMHLGGSSIFDKVNLPPISRTNTYPSYDGETPLVLGFGVQDRAHALTRYNFHKYCNDMRVASTTVIPLNQCQTQDRYRLHSSHICAQVKQHDPHYIEGTCLGDCGGPLITDGHILIGLLSAIRSDCNEVNNAAIYTRITSYLPFIHKAMNDERSDDTRYAEYINRQTSFGILGGSMKLVETFYPM